VQKGGRILRLIVPVSGVTLAAGEQFAVEKDFLLLASAETPLPRVYAVFMLPNDSESVRMSCATRLRDFLNCYTYHTGLAADFSEDFAGSVLDQVEPEKVGSIPFGEVRVHVGVVLEQAQSFLSAAAQMSKQRVPRYLQNALTFYRRSLAARRDDEALIDLMTALESIYSLDAAELAFRLSLRVACFIAGTDTSMREQIYDTVYEMYGLRSTILHSGEAADKLSLKKLASLREFVRVSISKFLLLQLNKTRKDIIRAIDSAIVKWKIPENAHTGDSSFGS